MASEQFIETGDNLSRFAIQLSGRWVSGNMDRIEQQTETFLNEILGGIKPSDEPLLFDISNVEEMDTYGAWLMERTRRRLSQLGHTVETNGLSADHAPLVKLIGGVNQNPPKTKRQTGLGKLIDAGIDQLRHFYLDVFSLASMLGALSSCFLSVLRAPSRFRFTSIVNQLDKVGWQAVPIIILITLLIGGIIAQQGFFHFSKLGAELYVVDMVGILVLREVGILLVAIMVAGRSGSAYTAELGSMKMREEIDALRTMGLNPVEILILPRVLMLILAVPMLTFIGSIAALYGGGVVAWLYGGMTPEIFIHRLKEAISLTHFQVGMIKAPFMGLIIGLVACTEGLRVKGSAESLGHQTTKSVVKSIFLVIVLDGMFAIFFASIGM